MTDYTEVIRQDSDWWIGWVEDLPGVNCQEATREELMVSLREALGDILELNRANARSLAGSDFTEIKPRP